MTPGSDTGVSAPEEDCWFPPPMVVAGGVGVASADAMPEEEDSALDVDV